MGKKIFLGNMLEDLKNEVKGSIQSLETEMQSMSADMQQMVTELINLKEVAAQGINEINIENSATGYSYKFLKTEKNIDSGAYVILSTIKSIATGSFGVNLEIKKVTGNGNFTLGYSINNGTIIDSSIFTATDAYKFFSLKLAANKGDIIKIYGAMAQNGYYNSVGTNSEIVYKIIDIVNDGAFAIVE